METAIEPTETLTVQETASLSAKMMDMSVQGLYLVDCRLVQQLKENEH